MVLVPFGRQLEWQRPSLYTADYSRKTPHQYAFFQIDGTMDEVRSHVQ